MSPFEIVYGFNPLTPLDLLSLPDISQFKDKSGQVKANYVKKMHEKVKSQIEKKMEGYAKYATKAGLMIMPSKGSSNAGKGPTLGVPQGRVSSPMC